jgi:hypothetical protein
MTEAVLTFVNGIRRTHGLGPVTSIQSVPAPTDKS